MVVLDAKKPHGFALKRGVCGINKNTYNTSQWKSE
jgi:hypothetical protein